VLLFSRTSYFVVFWVLEGGEQRQPLGHLANNFEMLITNSESRKPKCILGPLIFGGKHTSNILIMSLMLKIAGRRWLIL
jgi:hypothetical protein